MKVFLVTNSEGFYGQKMFPWESLDISKIILTLSKKFDVKHISFTELINGNINIEDSIILYSSSQQSEYKEYIEDILIYLMQKGNHLVPSFNIFKSHDNKGFQELHKKLLNIDSISAKYYGHYKEIKDEKIKFPIVYKSLDGFGSGDVSIAKTKEELVWNSSQDFCIFNKSSLKKIKTFFAKPIKKYLLGKKINDFETNGYYDYFKRFIIQDFIPNLKNDYKVLILNNKYFVAKRYVRKNDFRASGSGNFEFEKGYPELLDYAESLFIKFNEPYLSLDICSTENQHYLIEFQGTHFGPLFLLSAPGYYSKIDGVWKFIKEESNLDDEISMSLLNHLTKYTNKSKLSNE